jgi:hypothetical protein
MEEVMTIYELRLIGVLGFLAIGALVLLAGLAMVKLKDLAARVETRSAGSRVAFSLRGDARETARVIDRRQAAWRLRC